MKQAFLMLLTVCSLGGVLAAALPANAYVHHHHHVMVVHHKRHHHVTTVVVHHPYHH